MKRHLTLLLAVVLSVASVCVIAGCSNDKATDATAKTNLQRLVDDCETAERLGEINPYDFSEASWTAYEDALKKANSLLARGNGTAEEYNAAKEELQAAFDGLTVNKENLNSYIAECEKMDSSGWAEELEDAKKVANDPEATQSDVNRALGMLKQAVSGEKTESSSASESSSSSQTKTPTMGEQNALQKANDYLRLMPFSHSGLIDQLEFDGFTTTEATYAADNCGANWNEQAAKKAQDYIDLMSFSRSGLIDQLKFDGFTQEQAEYGVKAIGY